MKFTENKNAPNCRILAKGYLKCRMDHQLMDESDWDSLGLVNLPGERDVAPELLINRSTSKKETQSTDKVSSNP